MLPVFNGLILDVALIVILLTILAVGSFKGILHAAINFVLLVFSVLLSFLPLSNLIKTPLMQFLSSNIDLGVATPEHKLGVYMLYPFLASLILTLLFYVVFRLIKYLFVVMIQRKKKKVGIPSITSRIAGGIFSLVFNGVFVLALLSIFATELVGGTKTIEKSYVAKHIDKLDNEALKLIKDDKFHDKLIIKVLSSDLVMEVSDNDLNTFNIIIKAIDEDNIIPENLNNVQENLTNLHKMLTYMEKYGLNSQGVEVDGYELRIEQTREIANKSINEYVALHEGEDLIEASNTLAIRNLLVKFKLEDSAKLMDEIFIIN